MPKAKPTVKPTAPAKKTVSVKTNARPQTIVIPLKRDTDWEAVQELYRVGVASLRAIAAEHNCTEGAIRKRAKKESWSRDLAAKVKAKAEELVRKNEVRKTVRTTGEVTESMQIAAAATLQANIIIGHRRDIPSARSLVTKLFGELELQTDSIELLQQFGEIMRTENDAGQDKRNDLYNKVISLSGRSSTLKSLVDSLKVMIGLEREAFGLDDVQKGSSTDAMADFMADLASRGSRLPTGPKL